MRASILLFFVIIVLLGCKGKEKKSGLIILPHDQVISRLELGDRSIYHAKYADSMGNEISRELRERLNSGKLTRDFYVDSKGNIKEIRVRQMREEDIFNEIRIRAATGFPFENFQFISINCDSINESLKWAGYLDQSVRKGDSLDRSNMHSIDLSNKELVISIIERCGWNLIDSNLVNSTFLIIHHMDGGFMEHYYPKFIEFYKKGFLSNINYAQMLDRLLMNNGFDQIYGTQAVGKSFYKIKDPNNVNKRRNELGLTSIEEYARNFGFEYKQ